MTYNIIYEIKKALEENYVLLELHPLLIKQTIYHLNDRFIIKEDNEDSYPTPCRESYDYNITSYNFGTFCETSKIRAFIKIKTYEAANVIKILTSPRCVFENIEHDIGMKRDNEYLLKHCIDFAFCSTHIHYTVRAFLRICYLSNKPL